MKKLRNEIYWRIQHFFAGRHIFNDPEHSGKGPFITDPARRTIGNSAKIIPNTEWWNRNTTFILILVTIVTNASTLVTGRTIVYYPQQEEVKIGVKKFTPDPVTLSEYSFQDYLRRKQKK